MTFHADFWVVAGTAAPVIALSSILVLGDRLQLIADLEEKMDATPFREWPRMYRSIAYWYVITFAVTLGQAGALVISLLSLAEESDYISRTLMAAFQGISIFFLTLSTGIMVRHKAWYKRLKKQKDP